MQLLKGLTHLCITKMHLAVEVIREAAVVVQTTEICSTDIAYLQFLMSGRARSLAERFKLALAIRLDRLCLAELKVFRHREVDAAGRSENLNLL